MRNNVYMLNSQVTFHYTTLTPVVATINPLKIVAYILKFLVI